MINPDTEIRKLRPAELYALAKTLSPHSWKTLMGIIPKSESDNTPIFNSEYLGMIECAAAKQHRCPAEIFLDEWGTWGRKRPTVKFVIDLSIKAELFRTADFLAVQILKTQPPERPHLGPAAPVDIPEDFIDQLHLKNSSENLNSEFCQQSTIGVSDMINMSYPSIELPDFAALDVDDVGEIKVNYSESSVKNEKSQLIHCPDHPNLPITDLIKFSCKTPSDQQTVSNKFDKSVDLIEFSSKSLKQVQYGLEQSSSLLPNLEALKFDDPIEKKIESILIISSELNESPSFQLLEELQSSELPLCINSVVNKINPETQLDDSKISDSSEDSSCSTALESNSLNENSPQQISDNVGINLQQDHSSSNAPTIAICPAIIDSQELPLTVLEFSKC